jgi:predicted permease
MLSVFLQTLPFFLIIGLGYGAGRSGFFSQEGTAWLTKFVFYFALSAMLFRFSANLSLGDVLDWQVVLGYLAATSVVYLLATGVAYLRGVRIEEAAIEAQCAVIGNVGFLGVPMLAMLMGEAAIGPVMLVLAVDLLVFGSLVVILITGARDGRMSVRILGSIGLGLLRNPMIVAITAGFAWSALRLPIPETMNAFLAILGGAATPGALFAIGASLAAISVLWLFDVPPYTAAVVIAAAALPVAGNVFIIAQSYGVAPRRVSSAILISTLLAVLSVALVIGWTAALY